VQKEIIITINGPGELYGLSFPLVKEIRKQIENILITLIVVPCQFASGLESSTAVESGLFDNVIGVKEYKRWLITKKFSSSYQPLSEGIVLYLGGDALHALNLAKRFGFKAYAYDEGNVRHKNKFAKLFIPDLDGNLMVDAAQEKTVTYTNNPVGSDKIYIGMYPGSRKDHIRVMMPLYKQVVKLLSSEYPKLNFIWGLKDNLKDYFEKMYDLDEPIVYEQADTEYDVILCLTGTNTAINAVLGIPMVVLLPFNNPEVVPFMGLFGLISGIPILGKLLKYVALFYISKTFSFISIPNIKAKRMIVPDLIGFIKVKDVVEAIKGLIVNVRRREEIHEILPIVIGKPGAVNITNKLQEILA